MTSLEEYEFLVALLVAIVVLELGARRLNLPPAAALVLGGIALALTPGVPTFVIDPELVLLIFLPPLLMTAGYFTSWEEFRANIGAIGLLAVGAVAFTTGVVGVVAHLLVPDLPWAMCFALGAIVSPPDAVAAAAVLKRLSLPARLTATLEGESLINDASGLVLFRFAIAAALTDTFSASKAVGAFVYVAAAGTIIGICAGLIGVAILRRLKDPELAIVFTLLLPVAAYVAGERVEASGVLAVVATGIIVGRHQHQAMPAAVRLRAQGFWAVLTFLLQSILFILIGLALRDVVDRFGDLPDAGRSVWLPVMAVVAATIAARLAWVYGSWAARHASIRMGMHMLNTPSFATATVVGWAGMRGVVTLAVALAVPANLVGRDFVLVSAFAVILVTVLLQGTTLGPLIRALRLGDDDQVRAQESEDRARALIARAQLAALRNLPEGERRHPMLIQRYVRRADQTAALISDPDEHRAIRADHHTAIIAVVRAGREALLELSRSGDVPASVLRSIEWEMDLEQVTSENWLTEVQN